MATKRLDATTFGGRVRQARERVKGWSQDQLADAVDVTSNYIARVERNEARPSERLVTRLANVLTVLREDLGEPEAETKDEYPARKALLDDPEFKRADKPVRDRVMSWPDAGAEWTTRQWYELFSASLALHQKGKVNPKDDPSTRPARKRQR